MRQIRVTIIAIHFAIPPNLKDSHNVGVAITLDGVSMDNSSDRWNIGAQQSIMLPDDYTTATIDVEGRTDPLDLVVTVKIDEPGNSSVVGGPLKHSITWPFSPRVAMSRREEFAVEWQLENVNPAPDKVGRKGIYACREDKSGAVLFNTAGNVHHQLRVEVHEVIPTPRGNRATGGDGPLRPTSLNTDWEWTEGEKGKNAEQMAYGSDLNTVWNPAVIPILPTGTEPSAANCSKYRITYYWPKQFNFDEDDERLVWSIVSTGGGAAKFFGRKRGRTISLHGVTPGEVSLELRYNNTQVATCRALVAPLVSIPYRCTIIYGDAKNTDLRPKSKPEDIPIQMLIANRLLWQVGVTLVPYPDNTPGWLPLDIPSDNIAPVPSQPGFFQANAKSPEWTRIDTVDPRMVSAVNSLPWVFNFVYIVLNDDTTGGAACYMELQKNEYQIIDSGTPSGSWVPTSGVIPDEESKEVTMITAFDSPSSKDPMFPNRFTMYVTDLNKNNFQFGNIIAHEFGHVLGLFHRVEGRFLFDDKINYPPLQNVMHWSGNPNLAQDFDILQAKQVRRSPLLNPPRQRLCPTQNSPRTRTLISGTYNAPIHHPGIRGRRDPRYFPKTR